LHEKLGTWRKAKKNSDLFYTDKLTWEEWAKRDAKLWAGIEVNEVKRIAQKCPLTKGAKETVSKLRQKGFAVTVISGGVSFFADRVGQELKIAHVLANKLHERNRLLTGKVTVSVTSTNKRKLLLQLLRQLKLSPRQAAAVGDDFTVIPLFKIVRLSIAFNPLTIDVEKNAHVVVKSANLVDVLPHILKNCQINGCLN